MKFIISALLLIGLAACTGTVGGVRLGPEKNLKTYSQWLGRSLVVQARSTMSKDTPIVFASISNTNDLDSSSPLGRIMADQIMSYFVEKGFSNVSEIRLRRSLYLRENNKGASGEFLLSRDARAIAETTDVGAAFVGTYAEGGSNVIVTVRLVEIASGKILAAKDVAVPKTQNIKELLENDDDLGSQYNFFSTSRPISAF